MMRRRSRLGVLCIAALFANGCAVRCKLTPVDTPSNRLDAWVSWDSTGTPQYNVVTVLPWSDLLARARSARTSTSRIVLSASVVDACGDALAGHAWSRQHEIGGRSDEDFLEHHVRLRTAAGPQRLTLAVLVQGLEYGPLWQRTFDVPASGPGDLLLEPPQFMRTQGNGGTSAPELSWNVARYYDESMGAPIVHSAVHDFSMASGAVYALRVRVRDVADDRTVFEDEHEVRQTGSVTPIEVELPIQGLGRRVLELHLQDGTRIATTQGMFDIGFADLAEWGSVEAGRELLLLFFSREEIETLDAVPAANRAAAWERLWKSRDPDPTTSTNEFKAAVGRRIQHATVRFAEGRPGWQTDRGRVYIVWGTPEQVDAFQSPNALDRTERWTYDGGDTVFVFVDARGTGQYVLKRTNAPDFLQRLRREN
jgi:GWxTD domain-containing protein